LSRTIIRKRDVTRRTGLSHTTIWRYERVDLFPHRIKLNPAATDDTGPVGWFEDEVDDWIAARVRAAGKPQS
jgi:predicted DNA-binding transcriptional regulator AlpA